MVEHRLAKAGVAGSNPVSRSKSELTHQPRLSGLICLGQVRLGVDCYEHDSLPTPIAPRADSRQGGVLARHVSRHASSSLPPLPRFLLTGLGPGSRIKLLVVVTLLHRILTIALASVLLVGFIHCGHRHTDAWAPRSELNDELRYLPSGDFLQFATLGYEMVAADMLWVRATAMFGEGYGEDDSWQLWLYHMIDLVTDLDPNFRAAYKYGGTMLRLDRRLVDQSNLIFQKGAEALPNEWYFPFGIAMNYFLYKDDRKLAALYMEKAARAARETEKVMKEARARGDLDSPALDQRLAPPHYLANLAASLYSDSDQLELGLTFLLEEQRQLQDSPSRTAVDVKVLETRYLIARRDATAVVEQYRLAEGALPRTPQDVAALNLELPADPLGGRWAWDQSMGVPLGALISSAYVSVFSAIVRDKGLGTMSHGIHVVQGSDAAQP